MDRNVEERARITKWLYVNLRLRPKAYSLWKDMVNNMGKIFCLIGKSATGKDTIYNRILQNDSLDLHSIVLYTTRPIREGEQEGIEYHFTSVETLETLKRENKVIECRCYHTIHGDWYYYMVKDDQIDLDNKNYLIIGTVESFTMIRDYFGEEKVIPIYISLDDGIRLERALNRERKQDSPKYEEMCRRFLADSQDFSEEKLKAANIQKIFMNDHLDDCIREISNYIENQK